MKKILLGLLVLSSAVTFANQGINVYGKFGVDVVSRFNKISEEGETLIKSRFGVEKKILNLKIVMIRLLENSLDMIQFLYI